MNTNKALKVIISGRVQGVFFRMETRQAAIRLGITGWVRNRPDATVEAVFQGNAEDVIQMIDWCKKGPPMAAVSDIKVDEIEYSGEHMDFSIRY